MMTESTPPPMETGPAPDNGSVQSQGHRRRRRRRKNKSQQAGGQANSQVNGQANGQAGGQAPQMQAPSQQARPAAPQHHHNQGQNQNQGQGRQGRKKKKFFQKGGGQQAQPGNSVGQQQGKRRNRQKGPREFVGPMDHSYRAVNGNVADGPPSTIQIPGNHMGSYYAEAYTSAPAQVREDSPTRIFCFIEDLFFLAKIQETARKLGVKVEFVKGSDKVTIDRIAGAPEAEKPALMLPGAGERREDRHDFDGAGPRADDALAGVRAGSQKYGCVKRGCGRLTQKHGRFARKRGAGTQHQSDESAEQKLRRRH